MAQTFLHVFAITLSIVTKSCAIGPADSVSTASSIQPVRLSPFQYICALPTDAILCAKENTSVKASTIVLQAARASVEP